jgi:hypothetical protein
VASLYVAQPKESTSSHEVIIFPTLICPRPSKLTRSNSFKQMNTLFYTKIKEEVDFDSPPPFFEDQIFNHLYLEYEKTSIRNVLSSSHHHQFPVFFSNLFQNHPVYYLSNSRNVGDAQ